MNERLKEIRLHFNKTQEEFASSINIKSKAHISSIESGKRALTDRIINDVCSTYKVNEAWLRTGKGEMIIEEDIFSLDEMLRERKCTELETKVIKLAVKTYLSLPNEIRDTFIDTVLAEAQKLNRDNEISATLENDRDKAIEEVASTIDR